METKTCQNCKNDFTIESEDFDFYKKINVPAPTWCPECRFIRRLNFLNWSTLYKRNCDSCGNSMISAHHADTKYKVFCPDCWWKDSWDGTEYAKEYDSNRNFFEQIMELRDVSTFMALETFHTSLVNTPYANAVSYQKDSFMVFNGDYGEHAVYSTCFAHASECLDCFRVKEGELCYECTGIHKSYKCIFSEELDSCSEVLFSRALVGCTDCFGCINLKNKSYYIFNQPYSKEEYKEKIKSFKLDTHEGIENARKASLEFWIQHPQRSVIGNALNLNTTGDMVYESKNTKDAYGISSAEDSRYVQFLTLPSTKDCYDYTNWGSGAERLYECLTVGEGAYNDKFCVQCWVGAVDVEYSLYAIQPKNCFGCVNLKNKEYCILNKQYSKEEYEILKAQIIEDMKNNPYIDASGKVYSYGELFPVETSPYAYNESVAMDFFPLTKTEALAKGFVWYDAPENTNRATTTSVQIPQSSEEITDAIIQENIECAECKNPYRITQIELYLLKKNNLPLPHNCWKCRQKRRLSRTNKSKLYDRTCAKCSKDIKTAYAPERSEIVYCETCYQQEIV